MAPESILPSAPASAIGGLTGIKEPSLPSNSLTSSILAETQKKPATVISAGVSKTECESNQASRRLPGATGSSRSLGVSAMYRVARPSGLVPYREFTGICSTSRESVEKSFSHLDNQQICPIAKAKKHSIHQARDNGKAYQITSPTATLAIALGVIRSGSQAAGPERPRKIVFQNQ